MSLGAGSLIADKVRLVRLLGSGGMGHVWLADHLGLDTQVAVKLIAAEHAAIPEAVARFRQEAAAAAKMKCPHAVQILDYGVQEGCPFIVMELLEGEDLAHRIQRAGPLPVAFVGDVITQVCKALSRAHALGIVHRDIKPENVFISEDQGERLIKVLDFGIAKRRGDSELSMTSTGVALGSPYYMSPEQVVSAKTVDPRSDLWSLGVVAYQAMTGKLPFVGETVGALAIAINEGTYEPPSAARPGIPGAVDAWFQRALVKDLSARFQTAKEMAESFALTTGRSAGKEEFGEAETDVAPCPVAKPDCVDNCPTVRVSTPLLDLHGVSSPPEQAPVAALSGTHMTATVSQRLDRSRAPVVWGIASAAVLLLAVFGIGLAFALRNGAPAADAASQGQTEPAAGSPALTEPQPTVTPVVQVPEPARDPAPSTSAAPSAPKPAVAKPRLPVPPRPKKDRGF
ncbi:MAG: protein kinase [Myxococcales bacterium]|nr:protein kinase [Myxococcales bacterium]